MNTFRKKLVFTKAPEDTAFINKFMNTAVKLRKFNMPIDKAIEVMSLGEKLKMILKMLPFMPVIMKYNKISVRRIDFYIGITYKTIKSKTMYTMVIDTNVFISAFKSRNGASFKLPFRTDPGKYIRGRHKNGQIPRERTYA